LSVEARPLLTPADLESEAALDAYEIKRDAWGVRGWDQIARLCRFFDGVGMEGLNCPPPPERPDPG
jgi:hypothetical protein